MYEEDPHWFDLLLFQVTGG